MCIYKFIISFKVSIYKKILVLENLCEIDNNKFLIN